LINRAALPAALINKGGSARRPLRGTAAHSPTTARRVARRPTANVSGER